MPPSLPPPYQPFLPVVSYFLAPPLQHVDEQEGLYSFRRPDGGAIDCTFTDGEMLLLSVEGKHVAGGLGGGEERGL